MNTLHIKASVRFLLPLAFIILLVPGCVENKITEAPVENETGISTDKIRLVDSSDVTIAKWYNGHKAAISITYDNRPMASYYETVEAILERYEMRIDYEMVTKLYMEKPWIWDYFFNNLLPRNYGYFGHGHEHIDHDALSYDEAYNSFRKCFNLMRGWGLNPVAYAYPGGYNHEMETREACRDAGFLSARNHKREDSAQPYILADDKKIPDDWYALPSLVMQDYDFQNCEECVSNNGELIPYLLEALEKEAWLIPTYHSIGDTSGFGWYHLSEFEKDIRSISKNDFWAASLSDVTLYIRERNAAEGKIYSYADGDGVIKRLTVMIDDNLPNDVYSQPLSVLIKLPPEWIGRELRFYKTFGFDERYTINAMNGYFHCIPGNEPYYLEPVQM